MQQLVAHGRSPETPVALVRWGTTPEQQTVSGTLADIVDRVQAPGLKPPAVTVVGQVAALHETLRWFEGYPLFGQRPVGAASSPGRGGGRVTDDPDRPSGRLDAIGPGYRRPAEL